MHCNNNNEYDTYMKQIGCKKWLDENTYDIYELRYLWKLSTDVWYKLKLTILQFQFKIHLNYKTH